MSYTFLIIEDEPLTARFTKEILQDEGHKVIGVAKSADEARALLNNSSVDFIILDINIHGSEDGLQFAHSIADQQIAIVFITAYSDKATLIEATEILPYGFLVKPFNENDLFATLSVAIAQLKKERSSNTQTTHDNALEVQNFQGTDLSKRELDCINYFTQNPNTVINYNSLRENIWNDKYVNDVTIRELINRIRKKIPNLSVKNVYGQGYIYNK